MPCNDHVRDLMIAAIDGEDVPELDAHRMECGDCSDEWLRITTIDRLLDSAPMPQLPSGFATGVERHMARALDGATPWRGTLANIGLVVAGIATVLFALATLALRLDLGGTFDALTRTALFNAMMALAESTVRGPFGVLVLVALAAGLAMAWFAILLLPRLSPRADRG